jgi:hypothetical protein
MKVEVRTLVTKKLFGFICLILIFGLVSLAVIYNKPVKVPVNSDQYTVMLIFPSDKYPKTAAHIKEAIQSGESNICTIDRSGADQNRKESLKGIPTKSGYDRDEWPMAMCAEGGTGADIEYVPYADNRGSGSWVGNQLERYANGTKVKIVVN